MAQGTASLSFMSWPHSGAVVPLVWAAFQLKGRRKEETVSPGFTEVWPRFLLESENSGVRSGRWVGIIGEVPGGWVPPWAGRTRQAGACLWGLAGEWEVGVGVEVGVQLNSQTEVGAMTRSLQCW